MLLWILPPSHWTHEYASIVQWRLFDGQCYWFCRYMWGRSLTTTRIMTAWYRVPRWDCPSRREISYALWIERTKTGGRYGQPVKTSEQSLPRPIHIIVELAMLCLIPWIQQVVYPYMLVVVTCLILSVCRGNLAFKSHWILSKLMEIATSIYLFLMSEMKFSLELSDYWAFLLVHAACKP